MKTHLFIFSLFFLFIVCSCNKSQNKHIQTNASQIEEITIDAKNGKMLPVESFIEKMEYIKLETTDNNLIGEVSQILFMDSLLIVVDTRKAQSIQVFDMQGRYKYPIGGIGNGPAEYTTVTHVCLVPHENQIAVLDGPQHKVIHFKYNGEYISSEHIPFTLFYYEYLPSGNKVFDVSAMNDPAYGVYKENVVLVTNPTNDIQYGALHDIRNENFHFRMNNPLRKFGEEVYYSPNFTDTIFEVSDTAIIAKYYVNITWNKMPINKKTITNELYEEYRDTYFYFYGNYIELDSLTFMNISAPSGNPFLVYLHQTKETYLSSGIVYNPFFAFLNNFVPLARYKDDQIVICVPAYHMVASKENLYLCKEYIKDLDILYRDLTEDDNPVLFFYQLKKNL